MTLQDLLGAQVAPWQAAADTWRRLAEVLDDVDEQMIRGTRDLPEAWRSGAGATAAAEKATTLRTRVSATYAPVKNIGEQLELHGYAMSALRQQAEQIIASAQQAGYTVDTATMTITAPASAYMGGNLDRTGRETGMLLNDLRSVVERARAQDAETARILNGNAPSALGGSWAGQAGAISRAEELALKIKDPTYQPTAAELDELRNLIDKYGEDQAFAYELLNTLGPKGLLELNGTLATYQLDQPGKDTDDWLFNRHTADTVRDLQSGLGAMLETATEANGTRTGPRGETYVPGQYELSSQWVSDLMTAGRSKMDIGDPTSPVRYVEGVYGYQLLSPLLHNGDYDPAFVATVGGDIIDFERESGKGSALWTEARAENIRLDWTQGHDDNKTPAGYDPVNALMDGLSKNGAGTRELLTGVSESTTDSAASSGSRLPRLDYLLTDRDWDATADVPGGPGWAAELMQNGEDYKSTALDKFGVALERATTDHPGEDSRRLVEAIVYETNVDEQAQGFDNGANPSEGGKTKSFADNDLIRPELRDSMGNIMSAYIVDVNQNIAAGQPTTSESFRADQTHLLRFLADLGKDETAQQTVAAAEAVYAAGMYDHILSGRQNPDADLQGNLNAMQVVSHNYGSVLGNRDYGAALEHHATSDQKDETHNTSVENRYKVIGPLVETVVGAASARVPGGSDLINGFAGNVLSDLEESAKVDNQGRAAYEVGTMLGASRTAAVDITEMSLYHSGRLENLPTSLVGPDGNLTPADKWTEDQRLDWQRYKGGLGLDTVGKAATDTAESYQSGYSQAKDLTLKATDGGSK